MKAYQVAYWFDLLDILFSTCSLADKYRTQWSDESKTHPVKVEVDMGRYLLEKLSEIGVGPFNKRDLIAATFQKQNDTGYFFLTEVKTWQLRKKAHDNNLFSAKLKSKYL